MRLPGMDFTYGGPYFLTICSARRELVFGSIRDGHMNPNALGRIVTREWNALPQASPWVSLHILMVMPNHIHGILAIGWNERERPLPTEPRPRLDRVVGALKSRTTIAVNRVRGTPGASLWQRGYYEHIIRNERACEAIWHYIVANPANWKRDREYVEARPGRASPAPTESRSRDGDRGRRIPDPELL